MPDITFPVMQNNIYFKTLFMARLLSAIMVSWGLMVMLAVYLWRLLSANCF
jgi:hypothetical protein